MEVIPHGIPRISLVEGTTLITGATSPSVTQEATIVSKAKPVTLTVGIGDGNSSDISGLEVKVGPDWCLAVTKVESVKTNIRLYMDMTIFIA